MGYVATFEFRASIDPEEDVKQLQAGCDARAPGCKASIYNAESKLLPTKIFLSVPMEHFCTLRDYIALWQLGDMTQ